VRIADATVEAAFRRHRALYVEQLRWSVRGYAALWSLGAQAFAGNGDREAFENLYRAMIGWLVFRGPAGPRMPAAEVFEVLTEIGRRFPRLRKLSLAELATADAPDLRQALVLAGAIKRNKSGPSLVAVSKFLHFWNPRLFMIVDDQEIGARVLGRRWLRPLVLAVQDGIESAYGKFDPQNEPASYGLSYASILLWASRLVQSNPGILSPLEGYVRQQAEGLALPGDYASFAGAAVEWFLLGLSELPPAGVDISGRES
jgi:hypothetical protein